MAYGELFQREDKTELKEILFHQVCRALENIPLDDSVRERIEDIVNVIADKGVPEYLMALYLEDEKAAQFCEGCEDSPCCTKNDPVALTWKDVQKIAKGLKTTNKKVLKDTPYRTRTSTGRIFNIRSKTCCPVSGKTRTIAVKSTLSGRIYVWRIPSHRIKKTIQRSGWALRSTVTSLLT